MRGVGRTDALNISGLEARTLPTWFLTCHSHTASFFLPSHFLRSTHPPHSLPVSLLNALQLPRSLALPTTTTLSLDSGVRPTTSPVSPVLGGRILGLSNATTAPPCSFHNISYAPPDPPE